MKIAAYVDESGRHDKTGKQKGSSQIVVSGWVDWRDNWSKFCDQWQSILIKYGATEFHFQEWAYASRIVRTGQIPSASFHENPYRGWNLEKLDGFLYELAELAGGGQKLFVGGFISTRDFDEAKKHPAYTLFDLCNCSKAGAPGVENKTGRRIRKFSGLLLRIIFYEQPRLSPQLRHL